MASMSRRTATGVALSIASIFSITSLCVAAGESNLPAFPGVLPKPKEYRENGKPILLARTGQSVGVQILGNGAALQTAGKELFAQLQKFGVKAEAVSEKPHIQVSVPADWLEPATGPTLANKPEGYKLTVIPGSTPQVIIQGVDTIGAYYGVQTLIQLLDRSADGVTVRAAEVRDWPTFSYRLFKGQCWYYRDNQMYVQWAPRFKWNTFGSCYTDSPEWRNPSDTYKKMIAELCDSAVQAGNFRVIQLGNPFMIKEKAIRATAPGDVETLAAFFEPSLSHGSTSLMLCLDDFAYLPKEDMARFGTLAAANADMTTRFAEQIWARHPGVRILLCPPPYWLNANKSKNYEWAHEYLKEFCAKIPKPIAIVWTGHAVTSPCHAANDIKAYQELIGEDRGLFLWDNTLKLPPGWGNVFRMNPFLAACPSYKESAWPTMAAYTHGEAGINTYGPGEIYTVPLMTAADYLWNPESYDPQDSLRRALYWFDDNRAVGPMVHHWVNELHQKLYDKRIEFLKAPSTTVLDEIGDLVKQYRQEFDRIAAATANKALVEELRPYLKRHTGSLEPLEVMAKAWPLREANPAEAAKQIEKARQMLAALDKELEKGDIAGDKNGVVLQDLEKPGMKLIEEHLRSLNKGAPAATRADDLINAEMRKQLTAYLDDLCKWIVTLEPGTNLLKNTKDTAVSIFINGNFARVLMTASKITGNKAYLDEAMRWCDTFYSIQQLAITSKLNESGFWPDCGYGRNIYFGDAGTATTAFALGYRHADDARKAVYLKAMERYFLFVSEGTVYDPQAQGRKAADSWIIHTGPDAGALGCGYYKGHLSTAPYTIATANTGVSFFAELYAITGKPEYRETAINATKWLLKIRKADGEMPYILDGQTEKIWPLDTMSYCTEAFVAADMLLKDPELSKQLATELKPCIQWMLAGQNADGSWGKLRSEDQQRSPRAVTLLSWYYTRVEADPKVAEAIRKYCQYLLNPENSKAYGIKELVRTTGFVALVIEDLLEPGSTF